MTTKAIREKLVTYFQTAEDKKLKAIYTMVEDEINTNENDWDEHFVAELEKRSNDFINGTAILYTWEQTKRIAIKKAHATV